MSRAPSGDVAAATRHRLTTSPGTVRGILLQTTRFLYYLLRARPGDVVSLELFEDVGVEHRDGTKLAEQDKSFVSANPLADRSVALWKTLHNWVDAVSSEVLAPDHTRFVLYAPLAVMGEFCRRLHGANTRSEAEGAVEHLRASLLGSGGWAVGSTIKPHVEAVLDADHGLLVAVVVRLTVDTREHSEGTLRSFLQEKLVGDDALDEVLTWSHGWVKQAIEASVNYGQPARVAHRDFHQALLNYVRLHDRDTILRSVAGGATEKEIAAELAVRCYVRQLQIIDLDEVDILSAVNDFLSASIDRTTWSARGLISEAALEILERELTLMWRNKQIRTRAGHADKDPVDQGRLLFADCMEQQTRLDGLETPQAFVRGSWHALADDLTVGWHPGYETLLAVLKPSD